MTRRTVLITGAGKGLGAAFAHDAARSGSHVIVNNRTHDGVPHTAEAVADAITRAGGHASADLHAIQKAGAAESMVADILDRFGRLDAIILNAGTSGPARKVGDTTAADYRAVMDVNFHSNIDLVNAALPHLRLAEAGRILFVASSAGLYGVRGRSAYAASKGALIAYGRSLADELKRSAIKTNILLPYAATRMTMEETAAPDPRLAPDRAAGAATWLTSAACTRNGELWVAGAGHIRRAMAMENPGGPVPDGADTGFEQRAGSLAAIRDPREFSGAEAAFADFYAEARHTAYQD